MDKITFEKIMNSLRDRIEACASHLDKYKNDEDLDNISVKTLREDIDFAREEQSNMDQVKHNEIYHILGMGNLTASQIMSFTTLVSKYTSYSPDLKTIAGIGSISNIPRLKTHAQYQLKVLSNHVLVKKFRDGEPPVIEIETSVMPTTASSTNTAEGNIYTVGNIVIRDFEQFYKDLKKCRDRSLSNIKKDSVDKLKAEGGKLFGFDWQIDNGVALASEKNNMSLKLCEALKN